MIKKLVLFLMLIPSLCFADAGLIGVIGSGGGGAPSGGIVHVSTGTPGTVVNNEVLTFSFTCTAGTNRLLFITAFALDVDDISELVSVEYNETALTQVWAITNGESSSIGYYLLDADFPETPGAYNVEITYTDTGVDRQVGIANSFTGVHQTTPIGDPESTVPSYASAIATIDVAATSTSDLVIDGMAVYNIAPVIGSGQTLRGSDSIASLYGQTSTEQGVNGDVTMSWSNVADSAKVIGGVALKPAE